MRNDYVRSVWLAVLCALVLVGKVSAQKEPDMRSIAPFVMIVADTSGSMEYRADCQCPASGGCSDCYPTCSAPNDASHIPPVGKRNRWALLLESLTGTFTDFQCAPEDRTNGAHFTYDVGYALPYHRPWACPGGTPYCAYPGTETTPIQIQNGLLDNYASRIRFGLATFDGMRTYTGAGDLVTSFNSPRSLGAEGSYSYAGEKPVRYPTCTQTHYIDSGIRSSLAPEGGLVSLNTNLCATPPCDPAVISAEIQRRLLATRPFGGTPTGSALDDLYYHFKTELNDTMAGCRERYAVLITDGYPDDDFREYPVPGCACDTRGNCPPGDADVSCPYPTAVQAAYNLKHGKSDANTSDDPQLDKLFVVGMSIADNASRAGLNLIASAGGSLDSDNDGNEAFFAEDPSTLTATLDSLLGDLTKPISRSIPAFATGRSGMQYQVAAGFTISPETVPPGFTPPWKGILERRRFMCNELGIVSVPSLSDEDRFDTQLNKTPADQRMLWTALPGNPTTPIVQGRLDRIDTGTACGLNGCAQTLLKDVPLDLLGGINAARKTTLMDWMYGADGSVRAKIKLGDIYHSSPAIVGPPVADPGDQSYTLFRESTLIEERPTMMYVNSNDGILHAFVLEDHRVGTTSYTGGKELWGFVPPVLLSRLDSQLSAHQLNLDATPVVKDVYFGKGSAPSATDYKTVLITGMRSGGNAYMALDVTDPVNPKFMWQFTDPDMGLTYGQPLIVQARYQWPLGQPASLRAMAILPGGKGALEENTGLGCNTQNHSTESFRVPGGRLGHTTKVAPERTAGVMKHRLAVQCWGRAGRALYFVDVQTGKLIKKIFDDDSNPANGTMFPSPVTGSPTAYQDSVGMTATEGFVLDADGVLWRIDLTSPEQRPDEPLSGWTVRPFHDLFWDMGTNEGETTYERPILSLDDKHQLVVLVGTGDTDNFEKSTVMNRVVSLTEVTTNDTPRVPADYVAGMNWELRADGPDASGGFVRSELVTGTMALFAQQLFVASFISVGDTTDPCSAGLGRLWSLHYNKHGGDAYRNATNETGVYTYGPLRIPVVSTDTSSSNSDLGLFNIPKSAAEPNLLVLGLGSTQRITCDVAETQVGNYYQPNNSTVSNIKQQTQPSIWIVAQASSDNKSRTRADSKLGSLEVQMTRPVEFSQVSSWAGSIE